MIYYKRFNRFDKRNREYKQFVNLLKDFWYSLCKIDEFHLMQVTDTFENEYYEYMKLIMKKNYGTLVLAYDNGTPIGFALSYVWGVPNYLQTIEKKTTRAELYDLFVEESYRRRGIGKDMIDFVSDYYKSLGCTHLVIGLLANNINAYNLYKKVGFKDHNLELMKEL